MEATAVIADRVRADAEARAAEPYTDPGTTRVNAPCMICGCNVTATIWYIRNYGPETVRCWVHFGDPLPTPRDGHDDTVLCTGGCGNLTPVPEAGDPYCDDCALALIPEDVRAMQPWRGHER